MSEAKLRALILLITFALSAAGCRNAPATTQTPMAQDASLTVVFPLENRELIGGQPLRVTIYLVDHDEQPVEEATVEAELWTPSGEIFAIFPCPDQGQGRYLADTMQLPLRDGAGAWRVVARATWGDGKQSQGESTFKVLPSFSEELQKLYGFWIDTASPVFDYYVTNINDPDSRYHPYPDGNGGYVLLANTRQDQSYGIFVILDVHWRHADFPADEAAAIAYVQGLVGPHLMKLDISPEDLATRQLSFQGRPAWHLAGQWESTPTNENPPPGGLVEWMVFQHPDSEWLWTLVIATNEPANMAELQSLRETFEPGPQN